MNSTFYFFFCVEEPWISQTMETLHLLSFLNPLFPDLSLANSIKAQGGGDLLGEHHNLPQGTQFGFPWAQCNPANLGFIFTQSAAKEKESLCSPVWDVGTRDNSSIWAYGQSLSSFAVCELHNTTGVCTIVSLRNNNDLASSQVGWVLFFWVLLGMGKFPSKK